MPGVRQRYLKLQVFVVKKDDVTDEEFHTHWENLHGDICKTVPEFMKYVKRYNQVRPIPALLFLIATFLSAFQSYQDHKVYHVLL